MSARMKWWSSPSAVRISAFSACSSSSCSGAERSAASRAISGSTTARSSAAAAIVVALGAQRRDHLGVAAVGVDADAEDAAAAPAADLDQPLVLEQPQRVRDRRAADAERGRQLLLVGQPPAGRDGAQQDHAADLLGDVLVRARLIDVLQHVVHLVHRAHPVVRTQLRILRLRSCTSMSAPRRTPSVYSLPGFTHIVRPILTVPRDSCRWPCRPISGW